MFGIINAKLDEITELLERLIHKETTMGKELDDVAAAVTADTANEAALTDALVSAMALIDSLSAQLAAGVANQDGPALEALAQQLTTNNAAQQAKVAALLADIAKNTPAPAPTPVTPPPAPVAAAPVDTPAPADTPVPVADAADSTPAA